MIWYFGLMVLHIVPVCNIVTIFMMFLEVRNIYSVLFRGGTDYQTTVSLLAKRNTKLNLILLISYLYFPASGHKEIVADQL